LIRENTSGYKGVYLDKVRNKWVASTKINNKKIFIGRYDNIKDAARAYNKVIKTLHGEFAILNIV
jgi:endo-alpha-1,4-polygalactosaminidase (GH114 family)